MKHLILTTLTVVLFVYSFAQRNKDIESNEIKIQLDDGFGDQQITEFKEYGVLLKSVKENKKSKSETWKFNHYTSDLVFNQSGSIEISEWFYFKSSYKAKHHQIYVFQDFVEKIKVITVNVNNFEITEKDYRLKELLYKGNMYTIGDRLVLEALNGKENILHSINWKTEKQELIPVKFDGIKDKNVSFERFQKVADEEELLAFYRISESKKLTHFRAILFDKDLKELKRCNLYIEDERHLLSISGSKLEEDELAFTGTFSYDLNEASVGFYFLLYKDQEVRSLRFYRFLELENFLNYLPFSMKEKVKKERRKKDKKGQDYVLSYDFADHTVYKVENDYFFVGEAYFPTYDVVNRTDFNTAINYGTQVINTLETIFTGNQYTHAIVCRFNKVGGMEWHRTFDLWQIDKPFDERFFIDFKIDEDYIYLSHPTTNQVYSKKYTLTGRLNSEVGSPPFELSNQLKNLDWKNVDMRYWYNDYYLNSGVAEVKIGRDQIKTVLFLRKIKYK